MKKTKILSVILLFVFLSFLVAQYTDGNTKALKLDEHKTAIIFSEADHDFSLTDDVKKYPFIPTNVLQLFVYASLISILFSALFFQARSKLIFLTPIFYQANYVIRTP